MHTSDSRPLPGRRRTLLIALATCVALGLAVTKLGSGEVAGFAGDALYAVAAYLAIGMLWVRLRPIPLGFLTVAICWAIEFFQATGIPLRLAEQWIGWRYLLGTTFNWVDLIAYLLGGVLVAVLDARWRSRAMVLGSNRP
ncbi:DUF2809 domain-containing protein [Mycetocola lacteus]|uniref:ribosomal maturation YjgA family protein n=1 Tax=Mycetocola lacteus TaxID=76637 RepID=UPI00160191FD|nr:DUF2809 domain-containing protein [Mycetocola lacteus]